MKVELFKVGTYDGIMESLGHLVKNLNWKFGEYYLDVMSPVKELVNAKLGIIYHIGDVYTYRLPEEFKVIG